MLLSPTLNALFRAIQMPFLDRGKHVLRIYSVDPGVILDEIRIDLGGLKKAYSGITETKAVNDAKLSLK